MARIFVSYSRSDKPKVKKLIPLLREVYGIENVWWDEDFYGGQVWWEEIRRKIEQSDVFVYLMSPRSLGSPYCLAELEESRRLRKPILYVNLSKNTRVPEIIAQTHYVHLTGRVNRATIPPIIRSINEYASRPPSNEPPITETPVGLPVVPPTESRNHLADYSGQIFTGLVVTIIGGVILAFIIQADRFAPPGSASATSAIVNVTDTVASASDPTNTLDPLQVARTPVARNADWTPIERNFDGVTMVLVPAGCFDMGDDGIGGRQCFDEPFWIDKYEVTQAQFARLDGIQARAPGFSGDNRPVERVTWYEAQDFCESRGGQLPGEAEWEYAARGPDGLAYPWGHEFVADNVVYSGNSNDQTANVGSHAEGMSWVGAMDMSGNVWEWTRSEYRDYPYDPADGREIIGSDAGRVVRGGSWYHRMNFVRAATRLYFTSSSSYYSHGFRCVRSSS